MQLRYFGIEPYAPIYRAMQHFTALRIEGGTPLEDEIWLLQHQPIFTLGRNAKPHHLLNPGEIPVEQSDRGGEVTYHGPGQLIAYLLLDTARLRLGVRQLVTLMEQTVIELLQAYGVTAVADRQAPGVYVEGAKVAALGLRIRRHFSYHGLSLNIDMDLSPFERINPCGYAGMAVTSLKQLGIDTPLPQLQQQWLQRLLTALERERGQIEQLTVNYEGERWQQSRLTN